MRADVISRDIIKPSSPTPNNLKSFKLSLLEQLGPTIFGSMVFFYPCNSRIKPVDQLQKLKKSLSETLTHFYPLAGRLNGNISIDCNDSGADFLEAKVDSPLSDLLQEPSSDSFQHLIPTSVDSTETRTKLFLAQASFFECGGMAIGVCISHKLADATSIGLFMKSWAAISSRGSIKAVGSPVFDTAEIFPPGNFSEASPAPVVEPEIKMNQTLSKRFVFDSSSIQALQAKASTFEVNQPTRVEAVSALIWRCAMKATRTVSRTSKPSILANSASLRSRLSPPFTENSIGNLVSYFAAKTEQGRNETKLQILVSKIRQAKQRFRNEHVTKLVGNKDATEMICNYQREAGDMIASGGFDFYIITSACRFGLYETDFGLGKPVWVVLPSVKQKNIVVLQDTRETGGIEAWVNLNEQEMKLFEEDGELLCFASLNPSGVKFDVKASSSRKSVKKPRRESQQSKDLNKTSVTEKEEMSQVSSQEAQADTPISIDSIDDVVAAPRDKVVQACTVTSGLMAALGLFIREASHVASTQGLPVTDCSTDIQFGFETWHLGLIVGIVVFISSSRFLLLKSWPDFADSSEAANQQILTSLEPLDYLVVAFLPGISEELLFRGALMPLVGTNLNGIVAVGLLFGFLHLGSGRRYSFAVWASIVGIVYGYAAVLSSSLIVPMASHALNNLVGGLVWRYNSKLKSLK
ncbi:unnamed protein product [Cochlearia groenlandica]